MEVVKQAHNHKYQPQWVAVLVAGIKVTGSEPTRPNLEDWAQEDRHSGDDMEILN